MPDTPRQFAGLAQRLEESTPNTTDKLGAVEQDVDDEIDSYNMALALDIDDLELSNTQAEVAASLDDGTAAQPTTGSAAVHGEESVKRRKLADGVVEKASEEIIAPSTRREYDQ